MWTSDLFSVVSPSQQPKQAAFSFDMPSEMNSPQSDYSDEDSRSTSPVPVDPFSPISPRSIFQNYWAGSSNSADQEEELSQRLFKLQMPLVKFDEVNEGQSSHSTADLKEVEGPSKAAVVTAPSKPSVIADDASKSYRLPPAPDRSPTRRRQILPTPPTATIRPRPTCTKACCRPWSSTSALIKKPTQSCLRPARYTFSGSKSTTALDAAEVEVTSRSSLKKEVSFYSQVSVFEFAVPQEKRSDGWSKYFV